MKEDGCIALTLQDVQKANELSSSGSHRLFQETIATTGRFELRDPKTGKLSVARGHFHEPSKGCIYWFEADSPFCAIAGTLRLGNPVVEIVTSAGVYSTAANDEPALTKLAQSFLLSGLPPLRLVDLDAAPQMFTGNQNFAHFAWNEFPALSSLTKLGRGSCLGSGGNLKAA
jgi:hypothetical protein